MHQLPKKGYIIPFEKIESIVWIRFWPFSKFGTIE